MKLSLNRNTIIAMVIGGSLVLAGVAWWVEQDLLSVEKNSIENIAQSPVPLYQGLGHLVANLVDEEDYETHYMQVDVSLMTRSQRCAKAMAFYVPLFRSELLELMSRQTYKDMQQPEQRQILRSEARTRILKVAKERMKNPQIEEVLFTSFVIQ